VKTKSIHTVEDITYGKNSTKLKNAGLVIFTNWVIMS